VIDVSDTVEYWKQFHSSFKNHVDGVVCSYFYQLRQLRSGGQWGPADDMHTLACIPRHRDCWGMHAQVTDYRCLVRCHCWRHTSAAGNASWDSHADCWYPA